MKTRYAIALMNETKETILGIFDTKEEADAFAMANIKPHSMGLQYCFSSMFSGNTPVGRQISIYNFYNV